MSSAVAKDATDNIELIKSFQRGEEEAFDKLFRDYFPVLSLFAFRLTGDEQEAEDIVQDCFVSLWSRRHALDHIDSIRSYLYTAVRYQCIRYRKKIRSTNMQDAASAPEIADENLNIEALVVMAETVREIYSLIDLLPPRMQQVFRLYYLEGKSYQEIGKLLKTDPETVRNQRFKALQLIRKTIIPG